MNKPAIKESVTDTIIGLLINYPINILVLFVTFHYHLTPFWTATTLTITFTFIAIARKYFVRIWFQKRNKNYWKRKRAGLDQQVQQAKTN